MEENLITEFKEKVQDIIKKGFALIEDMKSLTLQFEKHEKDLDAMKEKDPELKEVIDNLTNLLKKFG